ncbi:MAG: sigma-70 family RNA polymerase sigma factor [Planctomycetota bacterium]
MVDVDEDALFENFCRNGDPAALGELFDRVAPALFRVARHLVRDTHDAEDLLHATFVTAIESRTRWDRERGLFPWLVGILVMRGRELLRARQRRPDPARLAAEVVEDPSDVAAARESEAAILASVDGLPEAYRAVVRLHLRHGLDAGEIATALDRPAGTVRTQLARGLRALRSALPVGASLVALRSAEAAALGSVRSLVMSAVAAKGAIAVSASTLGFLAMKKPLVAIVAAILVLAVGVAFWLRDAVEPTPPANAPAQTRVADALSHTALERTSEDAVDRKPVPSSTKPQQSAFGPLLVAPRGSLRVRARYDRAHGGEFAPGMIIHVWPGGRWSMPSQKEDRRGATDLSGEVTFSDLEPGPWRVMMPVWTPGNMIPETTGVEVVAGQEAIFEGEIDVGRMVTGIVVDDGDHPIAGASVVFTSTSHGAQPREVARTDASGRFHANAVAFESLVGVRARGHAQSQSVALPHGDEEVRIVMSATCGSLRCRVTHRGEPVPGAQVTARALTGVALRGMNSGPQPFIQASGSTDAQGLCVLEDLPVELISVSIHRGGLLDVTREVRIAERAVAELDVVIPEVGSVSGRVTLADGRPFAGAQVLVGDWLPVGARAAVDTTADGTFTIRSQPAGETGLVVWKEGTDESVITRVRVKEGEDTRVELVARLQPGVSGRVIDQDGNGVAGYVVIATEQSSWARSRRTTSGADGGFVIPSVGAHRIRVAAVPPGGADEVPAGTCVDLPSGSKDIELRVRRGAGHVGVILMRREGEPYADQAVRLRIDDQVEGHWSRTAADGRIGFDAVPPGRIHLEVVDGGLPRDVVEPFDIAPGEDRDLGVRMLLPKGRVILVLSDAEGRPWSGTPPVFTVRALDPRSEWRVETNLDAEGRRFADLGEGRCHIHLDNAAYRDLAVDDVVVDVPRGGEMLVPIVLTRGVSGVLTFAREPSDGLPQDAWLHLRIEDEQGRVLRARSVYATVGKPFRLDTCLAPGSYVVDADSTLGAHHHARFEVVAGVPFEVLVPIGS